MSVAGLSSNSPVTVFWLERRISALLGSMVKAKRRLRAWRESGGKREKSGDKEEGKGGEREGEEVIKSEGGKRRGVLAYQWCP